MVNCTVHPAELGLVKDGAALGDPSQAEFLNELRPLEDLLLAAIVPAQNCQKIHHGFAEEALILEVAHRGGAMPTVQVGVHRSMESCLET